MSLLSVGKVFQGSCHQGSGFPGPEPLRRSPSLEPPGLQHHRSGSQRPVEVIRLDLARWLPFDSWELAAPQNGSV